MDLLDTVPGLRDALLVGLARELRRLTGHVEELHFLDLAGRLAMRLTRLAQRVAARRAAARSASTGRTRSPTSRR